MKVKHKSLYVRMALIGVCSLTILLGLTSISVLAQDESKAPHEAPHEGHGNLAQAATNPIANLIQLQLLNSYKWDNHNSDGAANTFIIQPVYPVKLPWEKVPLLITRTTLGYVWTPDLGDPIGRKDGFGDMYALGLFLPKLKAKGIQLGVGYRLAIPTAGDNDFTGSGKWAAGPAALYLNLRTKNLQWGLFVFQQWSFAGSSARQQVDAISVQPVITYHFGKGWYVATPDDPSTYDFENDKWTWTIGPQVGKVTKIGKQPVKMFGAVYYNPEDDAGPTPKWTAKIGLTFLFPK